MNFVFFQNCISQHQIPYIKELLNDSRVHDVYVVVPRDVLAERKTMGWSGLDLVKDTGLKILLNPSVKEVEDLFCLPNSIYLFGGIRADKTIFSWLKISVKYNVTRALITELPNTFAFGSANGKPLWLHKIRFSLFDSKYADKIKYVFAMGNDAVNYFKSVNKKWKVYPFCYCVEDKSLPTSINEDSAVLKLCFVGSLAWWKAVTDIVKADSKMATDLREKISIDIVGEGPEKQKMQRIILKDQLSNIHFNGFLPNKLIPEFLSKQDILVLPSIYDGWGAVVNEALHAGLYVIVSDKCGSKDLFLKNNFCGKVFKAGDIGQLKAVISDCVKNVNAIKTQKEKRKQWAKECISGKILAKYMVDCINNEVSNTPWLKDNYENIN